MNELSAGERDDVVRQAYQELKAERIRAAVDKEKIRLQQVRPLWHRIFPWRITIERR